MSIYVGKYVTYKEKPYLVVQLIGETVRIINPNIDGPNRNLCVSPSNLTEINCPPAVLVSYRGTNYMVTGAKQPQVISMTSFKAMKWPENHGIRKEVLSLARL